MDIGGFLALFYYDGSNEPRRRTYAGIRSPGWQLAHHHCLSMREREYPDGSIHELRISWFKEGRNPVIFTYAARILKTVTKR